MSAKILSTGSYLPPTKVSNVDLETIMDTSDEWIKQRTGIASRYFEDVSSVHMATQASLKALKHIDKETIDCILVGTYTPDNLIPNVASEVKMALELNNNIPSFDINAACSGFIFTLHTARAFIEANMYERILVIGVDFNSRILDFTDRSTAVLFGDGAGAVVLEKDETNLFHSAIYSVNDTHHSLSLNNSSDFHNAFIKRDKRQDPYFKMKGSDVFKFAVESLRKGVLDILKENKLTTQDIDYVISHQANQRILDTGAKLLRMDPKQFLSNVQEVGNTSSGSVPLLLDQMNQKETFKKGMKIILIAFGGGLSYGSALIEWA